MTRSKGKQGARAAASTRLAREAPKQMSRTPFKQGQEALTQMSPRTVNAMQQALRHRSGTITTTMQEALKQISRRTAETMQEAPKQMSPTTAKRAPEHRVRTWRPYPCSSRPLSKQAPPPPRASTLPNALVCSRWRHTMRTGEIESVESGERSQTLSSVFGKNSCLFSLAPHDQ